MFSRRFLRIKVLKAVYGHMCGTETTVNATQKRMMFSIQKSYELYGVLMRLPVELAKYGRKAIEINRRKFTATEEDKNPNMYFVDNRLIAQIEAAPRFAELTDSAGFCWEEHEDILKKIYNRMRNREYYKRYVQAPDCYENDKNFLISFFRKEIEDFGPLYEILYEASVYWYDDIEYVAGKCVSDIAEAEEGKGIEVFNMFQKEDDRVFVNELLQYTLSDMDKNIEAIKGYIHNWEIERITLMDKIIICMAMTEINRFPKIPVRVTLDEYIELTKHYSTQNSNVFVNGILDKYVNLLKEEGRLNKTEK